MLFRSRSADSEAAGPLHLAYRATDGSQVRYAKCSAGDGVTWTKTDIATGASGAFGDPAFSIDEGTGAYIAVVENTGSGYRIDLYISNDGGATWQPRITAGTTFTTAPSELALSVRTILGLRVISIGYSTNTFATSSETRVRWTADDGANWQDQLLSSAADSHWPDLLVKRSTPDLFAAWCADESGTTKVKARHGVFGYF